MSAEREVVVRVRGLKTRIGGAWIHRGVDLTARRGDIVAIIGTSGGGKTTLLHEMIGLRRPDAGTVEVFGQDVHHLGWREHHRLRKRWGMLFQQGALFTALNVFDNVAFPLRELRTMGEPIDEALVHDIVMYKLQLTGLAAKDVNKRPAELSGGMIKRVALARALAVEAELLFLDEPGSGLDPVTAHELDELLTDLHRELGLTIVMVSHDLDSVAALANRAAVLADGRIVFEGPLEEMTDSQDAAVHETISQLLAGPRGAALKARTRPREKKPNRTDRP